MVNEQETRRCEQILTEAPAVIGTSMSKTIILAVKIVARGTISVGGQSTLPMLRWTGSMAVRLIVTLDPDAAHGTFCSSSSMA